MSRKTLYWIMITFATIGLFVSVYLTYLSLMPPTSCPIGSFGFFSCNEVIYSTYSKFYGISVAIFGLGWFIVALGLVLLTRYSWHFIRGVLVWSLLGVAGVAGFVYTEVFLIGSICPLCTIAHVTGVAMLILSLLGMRERIAPFES